MRLEWFAKINRTESSVLYLTRFSEFYCCAGNAGQEFWSFTAHTIAKSYHVSGAWSALCYGFKITCHSFLSLYLSIYQNKFDNNNLCGTSCCWRLNHRRVGYRNAFLLKPAVHWCWKTNIKIIRIHTTQSVVVFNRIFKRFSSCFISLYILILKFSVLYATVSIFVCFQLD